MIGPRGLSENDYTKQGCPPHVSAMYVVYSVLNIRARDSAVSFTAM